MATMASFAQKDENENNKWLGNRPDGHAPISVMGEHLHGKGEVMFSYRFMRMNMDELKQGTDDINFSDAILPNGNYMVTPTKMPMVMHMLGAMYAPSDRVTLVAMLNYLSSEMDHITAMGGTFTTESSGFGDIKLSALYKFFNKNRNQVHGQIGISIPTGSIDIEDVTPASAPNEVILPYPMQIGSGTFDTELAVTYLNQWDNFSFGSQLRSVIRFGENDNDYRLGNKYSINNWFAYKANDWLSLSTRIEGGIVDGINGRNPQLNPMMVITADTVNSGKTYIDAGIGFNLYAFKGSLKNLRFGGELSVPILQDLDGIQLKNKETITLGLQYAL